MRQRFDLTDEPPLPWRERLLRPPADAGPGGRWARRIGALVFALWGLSVWAGPMTELPTVLHLSLILFHEAGHVVFHPLGETWGVAGGSLMQWLIPAACMVSLARREDNFGAALGLGWLGLSLIDASIYAWDAADPRLPLLGGGTGADSFHDFIELFGRFGQLQHARAWARAMHVLGGLVLLAALAWVAVLLFRESQEAQSGP